MRVIKFNPVVFILQMIFVLPGLLLVWHFTNGGCALGIALVAIGVQISKGRS